MGIYDDASIIIKAALDAARPDQAVAGKLKELTFGSGRLVLLAVGKAAWNMASTASGCLGNRIDRGLVITKYGHSEGDLPRMEICEAGHPVPDQNTFAATEKAIGLIGGLQAEDTVLFLLSGGGSSLFEKPLLPADELQAITSQLLASGADIVEMNTIRKRLSAVKGGRFAKLCAPAKVISIILSDIIGDPLDMIASGPTCPDQSTAAQAQAIAHKYGLTLSDAARKLLQAETPKALYNVENHVTGSVKQLCAAAALTAEKLGYQPITLTAQLACEAREAGSFLAAIARHHAPGSTSKAYIAGGETIVHLKGSGLGGRNQELALSAGLAMEGLENVLLFSLGSDGTDGPTDAAGGIVDGSSARRIREAGKSPKEMLDNNDSYHALQASDGLIMTGPTGTNVNDLSVLLIKR